MTIHGVLTTLQVVHPQRYFLHQAHGAQYVLPARLSHIRSIRRAMLRKRQ